MEARPPRAEGKHWFQDEHSRMHRYFSYFLIFEINVFTFRKMSRLVTLDAYQRHKEMINLYYLYYPGANRHLLERDTTSDRTDYDVLKVR